jgi:hypothetical protein
MESVEGERTRRDLSDAESRGRCTRRRTRSIEKGGTLRMGGRERTTKRNWPSRVEVTEAVLCVVGHPALGSRWLLNSQGPG